MLSIRLFPQRFSKGKIILQKAPKTNNITKMYTPLLNMYKNEPYAFFLMFINTNIGFISNYYIYTEYYRLKELVV